MAILNDHNQAIPDSLRKDKTELIARAKENTSGAESEELLDKLNKALSALKNKVNMTKYTDILI